MALMFIKWSSSVIIWKPDKCVGFSNGLVIRCSDISKVDHSQVLYSDPHCMYIKNVYIKNIQETIMGLLNFYSGDPITRLVPIQLVGSLAHNQVWFPPINGLFLVFSGHLNVKQMPRPEHQTSLYNTDYVCCPLFRAFVFQISVLSYFFPVWSWPSRLRGIGRSAFGRFGHSKKKIEKISRKED
jgi:hypothetical protein